jgi:hypothetical protein
MGGIRVLVILASTVAILAAGVAASAAEQPDAATSVAPAEAAPAPSPPTWLLTVPTADVLPEGDYVLGVIQGGALPFHADIGALWRNLQIGVHGLKLQILQEGAPWAGIAVGATFGYYPAGLYVVGSKQLSDVRLHLGARFLPFTFSSDMPAAGATASPTPSGEDHAENSTPTANNDGTDDTFEVFAAAEKHLVQGRVRGILEVGDTLNGGFRFEVSPTWVFDVGMRVGLPERVRRSIGNKGTAYAFTSRDATAYLAFSYLSNWKLMGPPKEVPRVEADSTDGPSTGD